MREKDAEGGVSSLAEVRSRTARGVLAGANSRRNKIARAQNEGGQGETVSLYIGFRRGKVINEEDKERAVEKNKRR